MHEHLNHKEKNMKKFVIIMLIAVLAGSAVFAADFSVGIMQNYLHTMIIGDIDGDHFGAEGAVGIPLVSGIAGTIDYIKRGGIDPDTGEKEDYNPVGLFLLPAGVVNGYFKLVDTDHFELRTGLQVDAITLLNHDYFTFIALAGLSLGLDFKFNDGFSLNLTGALPVAAILPEAIRQYTLFYYTTNTDNNWDFLMIIPLCINQFARLSFKWEI